MDICYPDGADWSCMFDADELDALRADPVKAPVLERSEAFGWSLLAALTNYNIGVCPVTVRPCAKQCLPPGSYRAAPIYGGTIGGLNPYISGGHWYNACGCRGGCECTELSEVILPGPVGRIQTVRLDGDELTADKYRVDNGNRLVRLDGLTWPVCQDMTLSDLEGFSVTYYRGAPPNVMTKLAAGLLAAEFYKSCEGGECRLPGNVVSASRGGEQYQFDLNDYPEGKTGIPEVNAVITIYNPHALKAPIIVASPDVYETRVPTWR